MGRKGKGLETWGKSIRKNGQFPVEVSQAVRSPPSKFQVPLTGTQKGSDRFCACPGRGDPLLVEELCQERSKSAVREGGSKNLKKGGRGACQYSTWREESVSEERKILGNPRKLHSEPEGDTRRAERAFNVLY